MQVCACHPSIRVQTGPWGSMASWPSLLGKLQASEIYCLENEEDEDDEEDDKDDR